MAATDVVDLTRAKEALGVSLGDPRQHTLLQATVTAASERLDRACGPVVRRAVEEYHDGGCVTIRLGLEPVASITSLVEYDGSGVGTTLTGEDYDTPGTYLLEPWRVPDPAGLWSSRVTRRTTSRQTTMFARGRGNVQVAYTAGRYASTAAAQESRFGAACLLLVRWLWGQQVNQVIQSGEYDVPGVSYPAALPRSVRQLVAADWSEGVVVA